MPFMLTCDKITNFDFVTVTIWGLLFFDILHHENMVYHKYIFLLMNSIINIRIRVHRIMFIRTKYLISELYDDAYISSMFLFLVFHRQIRSIVPIKCH